MKKLSYPWSVYANLQAELSGNRRVSEQAWGTEAALNRFLDPSKNEPFFNIETATLAAASERRKERRRAKLRLIYLADCEQANEPEIMLDARQQLHQIELKIPVNDWSLLCRVGSGQNYDEIANAIGATPGSLRTRVTRLRGQLAG
jgi:DNA-directed RNA polymerase specialized sigma24 family protein